MDKETREEIITIKSLIRDMGEMVRKYVIKVDELERLVKKK